MRTIRNAKTRNVKLKGNKRKRKAAQSAVAIVTATGIAVGSAAIGMGFLIKGVKDYINSKYNGTAYVYKIDENRNVTVFDENGDVLEIIEGDDNIPNLAISTEEIKKDDSEKMPVYVLDDDGNLISGYMEQTDIDIKNGTTIGEFFSEEENEVNIGIVSAPNGALAQKDKPESYNSDNGELLAQGTYVLCGLTETSKGNASIWRRIIYFKDGEIPQTAYMEDEDILNIEKLDECRKIKVTYEFLNVRETARVEKDNIEYRLKQGDIVYQIPNVGEKKMNIMIGYL